MLKASIIGNLGGDPDMRYSPDGRPFLRMNVATNFRARNPEGEWEDRTEWVRVTIFGQQAERLSQYLKKGSKVYVDGRLEARPWTSNQGELRAGLEVIAADVQFMSARDDGEAGQPAGGREPGAGNSTGPSRGGAGRAPIPPADQGELEDLPF